MITGNILPSKVLAKRILKKEKVTKTGIIIAEVVQKEINVTAEVVMIGSGVAKILDSELEIGQTMLFSPHACQRFNLEDQEMLLVDSKDILFYFTPESL
jgi:co-chaperonin GroES (HSP10)